jgi:hypothetical protein
LVWLPVALRYSWCWRRCQWASATKDGELSGKAEADAEAAKASAKVEAERIRKAGRQQASAANAALQRLV